jgi:hypothetical protein
VHEGDYVHFFSEDEAWEHTPPVESNLTEALSLRKYINPLYYLNVTLFHLTPTWETGVDECEVKIAQEFQRIEGELKSLAVNKYEVEFTGKIEEAPILICKAIVLLQIHLFKGGDQ